MTALMKIQSFIQAYVKAIASILDVDVTIVNWFVWLEQAFMRTRLAKL